MDAAPPLLEVAGLKQHFPIVPNLVERLFGKKVRHVHAVDGVDLTVYRGETVGLVGESGCGKSTLARSVLRLYRAHGRVRRIRGPGNFELAAGGDAAAAEGYADYFPGPVRVAESPADGGTDCGLPLRIQGVPKHEIRGRVLELLEIVGLPPGHIDRFPHQFSGGQRQRIGIARALAVRPKFVVADEPVSALDVSIQAQIINLLERLQEEFGLTYLFITHDLSVVSYVSDRIAVMYLGRIVEWAKTEDLFAEPLHPYTQALLSAIPTVERRGRRRERIILQGSPPTPIDPPGGCRFYERCFLKEKNETCRLVDPELVDLGNGRRVACHAVAGTL